MSPDIEVCLKEIENCIQLLLPHPDTFFIAQSATPEQSSLSSHSHVIKRPVSPSEAPLQIYGKCQVCGTASDKNNLCSCIENFETVRESSNTNNTNVSNTDSSETIQGCSQQANPDNSDTSNALGSIQPKKWEEESDDSDDDFDDLDENVAFTQAYGLGSRNYQISVTVGGKYNRVEETDDNKDIIQTLKDQYRLAKKYLISVKSWLQVSHYSLL